jgi:RNA polymerase sigma-70 factor (ECF subfamily)
MVLRVCRATLRDEHEAQDAFQSTFLVLVRKAHSLWVRDSLGPWLFAVARRVAIGAKSGTARRRAHEQRAADLRAADFGVAGADDIGPALLEEVGRLPSRFRDPVILCYLDGRTYEETARHLRCPVGTIKSRLASGRERLRTRLARRGLAPSVGLVEMTLAARTALALVPTALAGATARTASQYAAGRAAAGVIPISVIALMDGARKSLSLIGGKIAVMLFLGLSVIIGSVRSHREGIASTAAQAHDRPAFSSFLVLVDPVPRPPGRLEVARSDVDRLDGPIPPPAERPDAVRIDGAIPPPAVRSEEVRIDGPIPPPAERPDVDPLDGPIPPPAERPGD